MQKIISFLWVDGQAKEAARLFTSLLEDLRISQITQETISILGDLELKDVISSIFAVSALGVSLFSLFLNQRLAQRTLVLGRKPVLVFEYDGRRGWLLRNVGAGPALNIVVAQKRVGGGWFNPVRIPPVSKDGQFLMEWLGHVNTTGLGATYSDSEEITYTSTCGNDLSKVAIGMLFGPWPESQVGRHWNHPPYREQR